MPDPYARLHTARKAVFLGAMSFLAAAATSGEPVMICRVMLIGVFLLLTTPVAAHAVARAVYQTMEKMETPGAVDEPGITSLGKECQKIK